MTDGGPQGTSMAPDGVSTQAAQRTGTTDEVYLPAALAAFVNLSDATASGELLSVEAELHASTERYRSLFENMLEGFAYCRMLYTDGVPADFIYLKTNPAFEKLTGLRNVEGRKVSEVIPGLRHSMPELFERYGRVALTGKPERFDAHFEDFGMWLSISVYSPAPEHFVAVFDNITERKAGEERIAYLNEVLRSVRGINRLITREKDRDQLLQQSCAILIGTRGCRWACIIALDERARPLTVAAAGSGEELATMRVRMQSGDLPACCQTALAPESRVVVVDPGKEGPIGQARPTHGSDVTIAMALRHQGRNLGVLTVAVSPAVASDPEDVGLLAEVADDIGLALHGFAQDAGRQLAEAEKKALEAQLLQAQKLESIGILAGGVAHEINNPIMGIMGYAELVAEKAASDPDIQEYVGAIRTETERVSTLVRNLLRFARQDRQEESKAVRLAEIVDGTLSLVRAIVRQDQVTLSVAIPADLPPVQCRSQRIQQVLLNLLTNARDALNEKYALYNPDKIISIAATVMVGSADGLRRVRLTVEDHGTGIPENVAAQMFEPFYTTKCRDKGTGLGLSISYGIIKDHGGEMSMETDIGNWTRFHVDLPVAV